MSKQINFYLTPKDQAELIAYLRREEEFVFLCTMVRGERTKTVERLEDIGQGWQIEIVQPHLVKHVVTSFVETQDYWSVDIDASPAIEFWRGGLSSDGEIRRGRFYFVMRYFKGEQFVEKDEAIVKWVDRMFRLTKKQLSHKHGFYYGAEALELTANGTLRFGF